MAIEATRVTAANRWSILANEILRQGWQGNLKSGFICGAVTLHRPLHRLNGIRDQPEQK